MLEWLKRHAWKACIRQKRIPGSNPGLSAQNAFNPLILSGFSFYPFRKFRLRLRSMMTIGAGLSALKVLQNFYHLIIAMSTSLSKIVKK